MRPKCTSVPYLRQVKHSMSVMQLPCGLARPIPHRLQRGQENHIPEHPGPQKSIQSMLSAEGKASQGHQEPSRSQLALVSSKGGVTPFSMTRAS